MTIVLTVGLMKKISLCKMSYFPEPYIRSKNKIKLELHLPNSAIKSDLKNATGVDASKFAKNANLSSIKSKIDKLDIDELETTPVDLSNLIDVVKVTKIVVKKTIYEKLVKKVNPIDTSGLIKKTSYDNKITEIEGKIPSISGLAIIAAFHAVKNEISNVFDLAKKAEYDAKISGIEKCILLFLIIINLRVK